MAQDILDKVSSRLAQDGISAVVLSSQDNVTYTIGYEVPSQAFPIRERNLCAVITADGKTVLQTPDMEYSLAKAQSCIKDVRMYNEFTQDPMQELVSVFNELGVANGTIAVEDDFLPASHYNNLVSLLPNARIIPARPILSELRAIKTASELDKLRRINKIAEQAHHFAAGKASAGATELQYAQHLTEFLYTNGAETITRLVVGAGERSEHGNANPTMRQMFEGEIVRADIFAKMGGYMSDVARTAVVGAPNADQKDKWKKIIDSHQMVLGMIRPGVSTKTIYDAFRAFFDKVGLTPINFVGHGLGVTLHEDPYISRYHDTILEPGMVLAIEPLYFTNGEGYQVEDIVAVTEDGYELITNCVPTTELIRI